MTSAFARGEPVRDPDGEIGFVLVDEREWREDELEGDGVVIVQFPGDPQPRAEMAWALKSVSAVEALARIVSVPGRT